MASPVVALSSLVDAFSGLTLRADRLRVAGANGFALQAADLGERLILDGAEGVPPMLVESQSQVSRLLPGDLVLRTRGVSNLATLVACDLGPVFAVSPLLVLRVRPGSLLEPAYLHWLLNSPALQAELDREARGTTIRMVAAASVRQLQIPVPQLPRQRQIAALAQQALREEALTRKLQGQRRHFLDQVLWHSAQNAGGIPPPGEKAKALGGANSQGLLDRN